MPLARYYEEGFVANLATFLEHASREASKDFVAHAFKADTAVLENRDSPEPCLVTSMLMAIIQENGRRLQPTLLRKSVRDDVCWDSAAEPWKRLPFWLVLRVAVARHLSENLGGDIGRIEYKFLVADLLCTFTDDIQQSSLSLQQLVFLKTKICRRLAKLDLEKEHARHQEVSDLVDTLFKELGNRFEGFIAVLAAVVDETWTRQKQSMTKTIPVLPQQAAAKDLLINTRASGAHLSAALTGAGQPRGCRGNLGDLSAAVALAAKQHLNDFAVKHSQLVEMEQFYAAFCSDLTDPSSEDICEAASKHINAYIDSTHIWYEGNSELQSHLVLTVMELWVKLDQAACEMFPLLLDFHPVFRKEMLDILLVSRYEDMLRLQRIQTYLHKRVSYCGNRACNIFVDPSKHCFAVRSYEESSDSAALQLLHERIGEWATNLRQAKEREWKTKMKEYEELSRRVDGMACVYLMDEDNPLGRGKHDPQCLRCRLMRQKARIRIEIYEHPLPADAVMAKTVVFELACPEMFALYRSTSWRLLYRLALPSDEQAGSGGTPRCLLKDYAPLSSFGNHHQAIFTLGSRTKSFLKTHYSSMTLPVEWENGRDGVCRPNGLRLAYFDTCSSSWIGQGQRRFSFAHHAKLNIPKSSPFSKLLQDAAFSDFSYGPSSYEVLATASNCPPGLNVHEYLAFQTVASGKSRRWLSILTELGSANINFSNEATMILLNHIALQAGPPSATDDPLRLCHSIFLDEVFCDKLMGQISERLASLVTNWRENHLMSTIISVALRIVDLTSAIGLHGVASKAMDILGEARSICVHWFKDLRAETLKASETETVQRFQQYGLWAALLCKETFSIHVDSLIRLDDASLIIFIQSSMFVQDNLATKVDSLPKTLRNAVIKDLRMGYKFRHVISDSIVSRPDVFRCAISELWPEADGDGRSLSSMRTETTGWISCLMQCSEDDNADQSVFYNVVEGLLLIDGSPIGKLPRDPERLYFLQELFGDHALPTVPSRVGGMQYHICLKPYGFRVHVGFNNSGDAVVRAYKGRFCLQYIPRDCFIDGTGADLPGPLLYDKIHWLDLKKSQVYIMPRDKPWPGESFRGHVLDLQQGMCTRERFIRGNRSFDCVVSPHSPLFSNIARIMSSLESPNHMLIFQPGSTRNIQVELPRLQLVFYVNQNGLLQSPQLQSEIDPDQNVGTWHGLRSKLTCRSLINPQSKSVLVPLGSIHPEKEGCHIQVDLEPTGTYGRFHVNTILGRIDSPSEPMLVYQKAMLHAFTSSPIPDELTGRTGTEEAIDWLQSAICTPWKPLSAGSMIKLESIAKLTPVREYYPVGGRSMHTDRWVSSLPTCVQDSRLKPLVDTIVQVSNALSQFELVPLVQQEDHRPRSIGDRHLHERALVRQLKFERRPDKNSEQNEMEPHVYEPRDRVSTSNIPHSNVLEVTSLLRQRPDRIETTAKLAQAFTSSPIIGGFDHIFDKVSLNDRLKTNVVQSWGSLVRFAREQTEPYGLMFLLGAISFNMHVDLALVRTLVAFAVFDDLKSLSLPSWSEYMHFRADQLPQLEYMLQLLKPFGTVKAEDDRDILAEFASAKERRKLLGEKAQHEKDVEKDLKTFANFLLRQWPCEDPSLDGLSDSLLLDVGPAMEAVRPEWKRLYQNIELSHHLRKAQLLLDQRHCDIRYRAPEFSLSEETYPRRSYNDCNLDLGQLLLRATVVEDRPMNGETGHFGCAAGHGEANGVVEWRPKVTVADMPAQTNSIKRMRKASVSSSSQLAELREMIERIGGSRSSVRRAYATALGESLVAYQGLKPAATRRDDAPKTDPATILKKRFTVHMEFEQIRSVLEKPTDGCSERRIGWLQLGGLWPAVTQSAVLRRLSTTSSQKAFGSGVRELILDFGVSITELQQRIRLHNLAARQQSSQHSEELANQGHTNWKPRDHPDWLLLEIESNIMIRPAQIDVARATIDPKSGSNSVLQMNMGQGKTSCIIPMAAAALADRKQLVRVIVPKALLQQTSELLQARLGGLLDRPLRHVPFARRTSTQESVIKTFHELHREIQKKAGVMICQPEHILSFMLSGRQRLLDEQLPQAGPMIKIQTWLGRVCRDILDESDFTLAVKTQLIYPSGSQMTVDGHPHRWQVVESLLRLVNGHMYNLAIEFPESVEVVRRAGGGFPLMFFLRQDVEDELIARLTKDIYAGRGAILPIGINLMTGADRVAIKDFITATRPRQRSCEVIRKLCPDQPNIRHTVYLLRGLLVNRILMMTLKKRWNVQYGLDPNRDPIAVPFHAKGVPSEQSEWGHPDVAILFTCLAFYYDGISLAQLRQSVEHILKSDDPAAEYDRWTHSTAQFPPSLMAWNSINVDDELQLTEMWNVVRYNVVVIDYFLNNFVFPRHAKQFKVKLQSNGWDIPLLPFGQESRNADATARKKPLSTGFSGTNDNRTMLPLTINQEDLPSLQHTSAEVLSYLLHPRNRKCVLPRDIRTCNSKGRATEVELLKGLKQRSIRILIDAGAQILEMDNKTLAETWLDIDGSALAALYFDKNSRAWVQPRTGMPVPLLASTFSDDLSMCLVYLDEAHTRGTDLKLPVQARGALTLGLGQTKDHTVQAAMRLRQLGTTQSVTFCVPSEVHQSIVDLQRDREKTLRHDIDSADVIEWLLENTCDGIEQLQPLYYGQGADFCRRMQAELDNTDFLTDRRQRETYVASIKQAEQQTLQQLYEPRTKGRVKVSSQVNDPQLRRFVKELDERKQSFQDTGKAVHASALQEVEQEREVAFEVESVRQVKKPLRYPALAFPGLHPDLESFARSGRIAADSSCFTHLFHSLSKTFVGRKFRVSPKASDSKMYVSAEFDRTIKLNVDLSSDNFIRPVNWILWSPISEITVAIIPEEAELLLPMMRDDETEKETHLLSYAAPTTRRMLHFDDLTFYSLPPLPSE